MKKDIVHVAEWSSLRNACSGVVGSNLADAIFVFELLNFCTFCFFGMSEYSFFSFFTGGENRFLFLPGSCSLYFGASLGVG